MPVFELGGSANKSTTTKNATTNTSGTFSKTSMPIVPDWAAGPIQTAAGRIGGLFGQDPGSFVAPANPLHQRAAQEAGWLNDSGWTFDAANGLMANAAGAAPASYQATTYGGATIAPTSNAQASSVLSNLDAYMSPYRQQVVDSALADFDHAAGQTRAQQDLDLAGAGAFGGSGAALTKSMTEGELARGRATTSANLLDQMFNRGAQLSNLDADRRTQAALANSQAANTAAVNQAQLLQQAGLQASDALNTAGQFNATQVENARRRQMEAARGMIDVAGAYGQNQRANIATEAQIGDLMRNVDQQQRQAPLTTTQQLVAMLNGLPINLFVGQNEQGVNAQTETSNSTEKNTTVEAKGGLKFP